MDTEDKPKIESLQCKHAAHRLGNVVVDAWLPVVVSGLPGPGLSPTIATHP